MEQTRICEGISRVPGAGHRKPNTMNLFISILFWAGIVLVVDGSFGLLLGEKWQRIISGLNIRRLALIEIGAGFGLVVMHFFMR